ncbi:MAG: hypothetical protein IJY01_06195, partial [Clostridia bacterium]|nr:hypothetical protein [Clostridia bacterium]
MKALIKAYKDAFSSYRDRAVRMLGITWFAGLISFLATVLLSGMLLLALAVDFVVTSSLAVIYLREYNKEKTSVEDVFAPFSDKEKLRRVVLGMAWMELWLFIWALIPIVGFVFAIIKGYKYRYTPYILMNEPEVPIMEAIKESERRTAGLRLDMFIADLAAYSVLAVVCIILGLLGMIPYVGVVFIILLVLVVIAGVAAMPVVTNALNCIFFVKRDEYLEAKGQGGAEAVSDTADIANDDTDVSTYDVSTNESTDDASANDATPAVVETVYMDEIIASERAFRGEDAEADATDTAPEAPAEAEPVAETVTEENEAIAEPVAEAEPVAASEAEEKPAPKKRASTAKKTTSAKTST